MEEHVQVGELYLEYIKGVKNKTKTKTTSPVGFVLNFPVQLQAWQELIPRPMPDQKALPELCYLPFDKTPTVTSSGSQRDVDDCQPRAQIKKKF